MVKIASNYLIASDQQTPHSARPATTVSSHYEDGAGHKYNSVETITIEPEHVLLVFKDTISTQKHSVSDCLIFVYRLMLMEDVSVVL